MSHDPQIIPWSYSAMSTFETCARQYEGKYVTKEVPYVQNAHAKWGDDVHIAMEKNLKTGDPLPSNMVQFQALLDAVKARGKQLRAHVVAEQPVALTRDLKQISWFTRKTAKVPVWFRIKIDVSLLAGDYAEIFDWKTGKKKDDPDQLHLCSLVIMLLYPNIKTVKAGYVWLPIQEITAPLVYRREQIGEMLAYWESKYERLEEAHITNNFPPTPSGLCYGWCEVKSCSHWKPKRGS